MKALLEEYGLIAVLFGLLIKLIMLHTVFLCHYGVEMFKHEEIDHSS